MNKDEAGAFKALKAERGIRRRAQADNKKLVEELATVQLQLTKLSAENKRFRADNYRLTAANKKIMNDKRNHIEDTRRRDQTIKSLRAQLKEKV